jgi:GT2 family glycosyltransferase
MLSAWSFERYLSNDYLGPVIAVVSPELPSEGNFSRPRDLIENNQSIFRIPLSTYETDTDTNSVALRHNHFSVVQDWLDTNRSGAITGAMSENSPLNISYATRASGKVSIIIPTRGTKLESSKMSMVESCVTSTLRQNQEGLILEIILVVDTDTDLDYVEQIREIMPSRIAFKVVEFELPFNFSRKCNDGAKVANGDVFIFLNDDTEWIGEDGLRELVATSGLANAGIVGALLLYPDGYIQHAGHAVREPDILHAYRYQLPHKVKNGDMEVTHEVTGVTGACMGITREIFSKIGGWNVDFPNSFNDVDLCLTARELGYEVLQCNKVKLIHHESITRDVPVYTKDHRNLIEKWGRTLFVESYIRNPEALGNSSDLLNETGREKADLTGKYFRYFFYILKKHGLRGIIQSFVGVIIKITSPRANSSKILDL